MFLQNLFKKFKKNPVKISKVEQYKKGIIEQTVKTEKYTQEYNNLYVEMEQLKEYKQILEKNRKLVNEIEKLKTEMQELEDEIQHIIWGESEVNLEDDIETNQNKDDGEEYDEQ